MRLFSKFSLLRKALKKRDTRSSSVPMRLLSTILWLSLCFVGGLELSVFLYGAGAEYMAKPISVNEEYETALALFSSTVRLIFIAVLAAIALRTGQFIYYDKLREFLHEKLRARMKRRLSEDAYKQWKKRRFNMLTLSLKDIFKSLAIIVAVMCSFIYIGFNVLVAGMNVGTSYNLTAQSRSVMFVAPMMVKMEHVWDPTRLFVRKGVKPISLHESRNEILLNDGAAFGYAAMYMSPRWQSDKDNVAYRDFIDNTVTALQRFEKMDGEGVFSGNYPEGSAAATALKITRKATYGGFYQKMSQLRARVNDRGYIESEIAYHESRCKKGSGKSNSQCEANTLYYTVLLKFYFEKTEVYSGG